MCYHAVHRSDGEWVILWPDQFKINGVYILRLWLRNWAKMRLRMPTRIFKMREPIPNKQVQFARNAYYGKHHYYYVPIMLPPKTVSHLCYRHEWFCHFMGPKMKDDEGDQNNCLLNQNKKKRKEQRYKTNKTPCLHTNTRRWPEGTGELRYTR